MKIRATPAIALLAALRSAAAPADPSAPEIAWDQDLAFEHDRENYQRTLSGIVDGAWRLAQAETGLAPRRGVKVRVHSRAGYERAFGTGAAWNRGAHYSRGEIHVNGGNRLDDRLAGGMAHEMVHAVLDHQGTAWRLPTWLNEGLAERVGWKRMGLDDLAPNQVLELQYHGRERALVPLPTHGPIGKAEYLHSYAAVLFVEKKAGRGTLLAVVRRTLEGEPFEKALDAETRWTVADLEREFADWVAHLR
ncbi:MAG TPA: hypothetical protein VFR85_18725 [Anaeromyxobacteraceae bacterium]|nr:hypothetical protein [Anaeromyxobacteraceae bacterium]